MLVAVTGRGRLHQRPHRHLLARATAESTRPSSAPTRYVDAGADGIFVPGVKDEARDRRGSPRRSRVPLNVLFLPGLPVPRLAELGVARISTGSLLYRVALGAAIDAAAAVRDGGPACSDAPSYAAVDALARDVPRRS